MSSSNEPDRSGPHADFAWRVGTAVLFALLLLAAAYILWSGVHVLLVAFAGVLFAVFLTALSDWLGRHTGLSHGWALAAVLIGLALAASGVGWLLADRLAQQVNDFAQQLPNSFQAIHDYLDRYTWGHLLLEKVPQAAGSLAQVGTFSQVTGLVSGVASFLVDAVVILAVGIFGAAEPNLYKEGLLHLVPFRHRQRATDALEALDFNLRWWLVGQVVLMIIIGATTAVGLYLIGVRFALALGLLAGILEAVPYLGPWLSAVPAILMALLLSPAHVLATLGLYLGLHVLEGYILLPLIQRRAVHLPPALTLLTQVLLGQLAGFMGLFVAAPLTLSAVVLLKIVYVQDALGDETVRVSGEPAQEQQSAAGAGS